MKYTRECYKAVFTAVQKELKLQKGDKVLIERAPMHENSTEFGWNSWESAMDALVGNEYEVNDVSDLNVFISVPRRNGEAPYSITVPITILKVVERKNPWNDKVNMLHGVPVRRESHDTVAFTVYSDGSALFNSRDKGGPTNAIDFETIKRLYEVALAAPNRL